MAYPELVSRGVSKSRKFKWLVKVGACKDVNLLIKKNHGRGGGGGGVSGQPETPPGYATANANLDSVYCHWRQWVADTTCWSDLADVVGHTIGSLVFLC